MAQGFLAAVWSAGQYSGQCGVHNGRCSGRQRLNSRHNGGRMFEQTFKNIDDVLWKEAGCATELDYTEQTSWILFLKYLDDLERANEQKAELTGKKYTYIIDKPYRWSVWAAPKKKDNTFDHDKALT